MSTSEPGEGRRALSSEEAAEILKTDIVRMVVEAETEYEVGLRLQPGISEDAATVIRGEAPPLRTSGIARFGFAGEPPDGWSTAERRILADARLRTEIEDGEPETMRFPWGVALMFLVMLLGTMGCLLGFGWALYRTFS